MCLGEFIVKTSFFLVGTLTGLHAQVALTGADHDDDVHASRHDLALGDSGSVRIKSRKDLELMTLSVKIAASNPLNSALQFGTTEISLADIDTKIPKIVKIPLEIPLSLRAVRVVVHGAEGLVSSVPGKPPSPYCSVYLLGMYVCRCFTNSFPCVSNNVL